MRSREPPDHGRVTPREVFRPDGQPTGQRFNVAYADDERLYGLLRNLRRTTPE